MQIDKSDTAKQISEINIKCILFANGFYSAVCTS